ncbi:uncharacterized protein [Neodiprion pinetum]|uniref:uncharacterized protein isoform X2 n=1 Tax=Neodiprion pinetum TaxID=441929 RepID=UPI003714DB97
MSHSTVTLTLRIYSLEPLPTNCRSSGIQKRHVEHPRIRKNKFTIQRVQDSFCEHLQSITRGGWRWLEVIEVDQDEDEEDEENEDFCTT